MIAARRSLTVTVLAPVILAVLAASAFAFWRTTGSGTGSATAASTWTENTGASVSSVNPTSRGQNSAQTTATITGSGFTSGTWTANFGTNITVGTVAFQNATTITAQITVLSGAATGARNFSITKAGTTYTCINCFTVNAAPTITSASPNTALAHDGATTVVTLTGTGFVSGFTPTSSGPNYVLSVNQFVSSTQVKVNVKNNNTNPGTDTRNIIITNPDGGVGTGSNMLHN